MTFSPYLPCLQISSTGVVSYGPSSVTRMDTELLYTDISSSSRRWKCIWKWNIRVGKRACKSSIWMDRLGHHAMLRSCLDKRANEWILVLHTIQPQNFLLIFIHSPKFVVFANGCLTAMQGCYCAGAGRRWGGGETGERWWWWKCMANGRLEGWFWVTQSWFGGEKLILKVGHLHFSVPFSLFLSLALFFFSFCPVSSLSTARDIPPLFLFTSPLPSWLPGSLLSSRLLASQLSSCSMNSNDSDIPERIAAARREAEALKDRIKQRKEALADSTCKYSETRKEKKY